MLIGAHFSACMTAFLQYSNQEWFLSAYSGSDDRAVQQPEHTQQGSSDTDPSHRAHWSLQQIKAVEIFHRMRNPRELGPPYEG